MAMISVSAALDEFFALDFIGPLILCPGRVVSKGAAAVSGSKSLATFTFPQNTSKYDIESVYDEVFR
jgi:hypothetical protein